jgi:hypothetical protein
VIALSFLIPLGVLALLVLGVVTFVRAARKTSIAESKHWYLWPFTSGQDLLAQVLLSLGIVFATLAAVLVHARLGGPFVEEAFVLAGAGAAVALAYWLRAPLVLIVGLLGGFGAVESYLARWLPEGLQQSVATLAVPALLGLCLYGIARLVESADSEPQWRRRFASAYWLLGTLALVLCLFIGSSEGSDFFAGNSILPAGRGAAVWVLAATTVALALVALVLALLALVRKHVLLAEFAAFAAVAVALLAYAFVPGSSLVLPNLVLLGLLMGLLFLGYARREDWLVTLATALLFIFVVAKYFGWALSLLDRSLAFVAAGVLFLVVGWLMERSRRYIIGKMEPADASQ